VGHALPERIDILKYPWSRAQFLQYVLNPLARDGLARLATSVSCAPFMRARASDPVGHIEGRQREILQREILQSIMNLGYRTDLARPEVYHPSMTSCESDIVVDIGEDGDIVVVDGMHRAMFLFIAGQPVVARVRNRHPMWAKFVESIYEVTDGYLYQGLPHYDFDSMRVGREETRVKQVFEAVRDLNIRSAVDYGSNMGSFPCGLASFIPDVLGVEPEALRVKVSEWLVRHTGATCRFAVGDVISLRFEVDMACMLSVLHHVITMHGVEATNAMLTDMAKHCKYLLLELNLPDEPVLRDKDAAREWMENHEKHLNACGWRRFRFVGDDTGFPAVKRSLWLWRSEGCL